MGHDAPGPPMGRYTVDDLLTLPELSCHVDLLDGHLFFASPQTDFHSVAVDLLRSGLHATVPRHLKVTRQMTVILDRRNAPEPDVSVIRASALTSLDQLAFIGEDVLLAVEVTGPESASRDRHTKPPKYAAAGIPHFWLVEHDGQWRPVVHVHELDPATNTYVHVGTHRDQIKVNVPYPINIDLTAIDAL
ncbi:Uma2 family endonuclease [Actinomycetota bacterium Odt1-20B]